MKRAILAATLLFRGMSIAQEAKPVPAGRAAGKGANAANRQAAPVRRTIRSAQATPDSPRISGRYDLIVPVTHDEATGGSCLVPPVSSEAFLSVADIVKALGNTDPFQFVAEGDNIAVYYAPKSKTTTEVTTESKDQVTTESKGEVKTESTDVKKKVNQEGSAAAGVPVPTESEKRQLASLEAKVKKLATEQKAFRVQLTVPHAAALGDLKAAVSSLNYGEFTVESVGIDTVRVSAKETPTCERWTSFLIDLRRLAWKPTAVPAVARLFYADASNVIAALSGGGGDADSAKAQPAKAVKAAPADNTADASSDSGDSGAASAAPAASDNSANPAPVAAGPTPSKPSAAGKGGPAKPGAAGDASSDAKDGGAAAPSIGLIKPDILVFPQPTPGNDAAIQEKKRIIASVDFPRPEILLTVWTVQASSSNPLDVVKLTSDLQIDVANFNERLQGAFGRGWASLSGQIASQPPKEADHCPAFFACGFFDYLTNRSIIQPPTVGVPPPSAQDFLDMKEGQAPLDDGKRQANHVCPASKYCLGYSSLLYPVKPGLTDMLLTLIAAKQPAEVANLAIQAMEPSTDPLAHSLSAKGTCWEVDQHQRPNSKEESRAKERKDEPDPPYFDCFWRASQFLLGDPQRLGLIRAALADFLYGYKLSEQFPHEFSPYQLSNSAQVLNRALRPLTDAFSEDVAVYQSKLKKRITDLGPARQPFLGQDKQSFLNSGIVTVRTLSGNDAVVDTQTQSYLNVSEAPTPAELISSISSAKSAGAGKLLGASPSSMAAPAIVGALNAFQTTEARIGRGLKVELKPRTLSGASSAEIAVTLNIDESAEPARYGKSDAQGKSDNDNLSRVARHDTSTTVRVDSLKIFDVSSLSAVLERSRSRFPLLPVPGLELPYFGTLLGLPLPASKEYHSSTAVLTAEVVPTAGDLAISAEFQADRILVKCQAGQGGFCTRPAKSTRDFFDQPIAAFHRNMMQCLASGTEDCSALEFEEIHDVP